ncbi:MAG: Hint domain-containing protein [Sphingomonadales bacterium]|nr:Hint domain-containing protein [Sphingomonadales bacterium]
MKTGSCGTFVISWTQSEIEGEASAPLDFLRAGAAWRWHGAALRIDGPQDILVLRGAMGEAEIRQRAQRMLRRLIGFGPVAGPAPACDLDPGIGQGFSLTDGYDLWQGAVIEGRSGRLLCFSGRVPPEGTKLWVVSVEPRRDRADAGAEAIGFVAGTRIDTPEGPRPVETLRAGDRVITRDAGAQPLLWVGQRRAGAARLIADPGMRPVRLARGALGADGPARDLLLAPGHRLLISGRAPARLFDSEAVLVAARDLLGPGRARVAQDLPGVNYVHLLCAQHQVLRAEGLWAESFHPSSAGPETLTPEARLALLRALPGLADNPAAYGEAAHRSLSRGEAAILQAGGAA